MATYTLSYLIRAGFEVIWDCEVCRNIGPVDLNAARDLLGPDATLANRRPRCRQPGCPGRVKFKRMNGLWAYSMDTITDRDEAWWVYSDEERARLEALGWRMQSGQWVAPEPSPPSPR